MHLFARALKQSRSLAAFLILSSLTPLAAPAQHHTRRERAPEHTVTPWQHAVQLRDKLEAQPPAQRTRDRYEEVLDAFRAIYHDKPAASKAPAAVAAVADLLAEKGRVLHDPNASRAALGQYEFLRQQYPHSPQVDDALLLEAEICRQDLNDTGCAREKLRQVIHELPDTSYSEQARLELNQMEGIRTPPRRSASRASRQSLPESAHNEPPRPEPDHPEQSRQARETAPPPPAPDQPRVAQPSENQPLSPLPVDTRTPPDGKPVLITGIRHWSNPTSTRIAIDLGGKVEYEAARVPNPDRIFFDLHGARLAPGLNGKEVQVIDDGYLKRIRAAQFQHDVTRVVLDITDVSGYSAFLLPDPWRLIIDVHSDKSANRLAASNAKPAPQTDNSLADVAALSAEPAKVTATAGPTARPVVARVPSSGPSDGAPAPGPDTTAANTPPAPDSKTRRNSRRGATPGTASEDASTPHPADPTSDGERSLVRALGLKVSRIVIDPGHGGHDSGTLGPGGIEEKDVVLDVALRVGRLLHDRLGAEIVYTRDTDTFIPLETRTAIANKAQADLFLSIHANSSPEPDARGVEAYYLNFTSDPTALDVAARENALSTSGVHQLSDLVRKIALKDKIDESREFAADIDTGLYDGLRKGNPGLKDRGVKKAPFVVLIGAQMPSVLAEISFLTNPEDAEELREPEYRERIAKALDAGVERYLRGLSGTRPRPSGKALAATASSDDGSGQ